MTEATTAAADTVVTTAATAVSDTAAKDTTTTAVVAAATDKPAAATTDAPAGKAVTLAAGTDADGKNAATFPATWREEMADGDEALLKTLQRYTDPKQAGKAIREQQKALSARKPEVAKPPADATEEQIAEYRKAVGLPTTVEDYIKDLKLPDGRSLGAPDRAVVEQFAKEVGLSKDSNLSQNDFNQITGWYFKTLQDAEDTRATEDHTYRLTTEDELRKEFGADFRPNINAIGTLFDGAPKEFKDRFLAGRLADGRKIGDDKDTLVFLSRLARELNPAASIVPASGAAGGATVDSRIAEIEKLMNTDLPSYQRNDALRNEYRGLLDARIKMQKRAG